MDFEDMMEAMAFAEIFADAQNYPPHIEQASLTIEEGGMGIVKWDKNTSTFQVLAFYIDTAVQGPQSVDEIVGTTAIIKNDNPIATGVVELDDTKPDEVWFRLK